MKYYYLNENNVQFGPVDKEELLKKITGESYIWTDGMKDWEKAKDLPAFVNNFNNVSSETNVNYNYSYDSETKQPDTIINENIKPNSHLIIAIVTLVLFGIFSGPFGILGLINAIKCEIKWRKDYNSALNYSRKARIYSTIAIPIGIIGVILYFIFVFNSMNSLYF